MTTGRFFPMFAIVALFLIISVSMASAEIKCQEPFRQVVDEGFETSARGKLEGIARILNAGGSVDIKPIVRNLIREYPNADKVSAQYQLIQLTCEMIKNLSITDKEKFEQLQKLRTDILSEFRSGSHSFLLKDKVFSIMKASKRDYSIHVFFFARLKTFKMCRRLQTSVVMSDGVGSQWLPVNKLPGVHRNNPLLDDVMFSVDFNVLKVHINETRESMDYMLRPKECVNFDWSAYISIYDDGLVHDKYYYRMVYLGNGDDEWKYSIKQITEEAFRAAENSVKTYKGECGTGVSGLGLGGRFLTDVLPDQYPKAICSSEPLNVVIEKAIEK